MSEENHCPQCGAAVPAHSPQGLCPGCLLKRGLDTHTEGRPDAAAECPPPTPEEIAALFPDLEILELVGRGGMGVVYKARQKPLDRLVALKILAPTIGQDPAFAERFVREARAMAMLSHPHVVAVYDFGQTQGEGISASPLPSPLSSLPLYYFLMEFVDGVNLRRLLDTGKLAPEEALAIVPQICEALQYAHDHGVVHRDIKPENVLLDKEGQVKIADFGIAKLVGRKVASTSSPLPPGEGKGEDASSNPQSLIPNPSPLTAVGQIMGTPQYMAPEQIEHPLQVDHRADIYSLGVVFYQMLTGELPTGRFAPPSKRVQIDVRLDEVVLRALEKEPERRYRQASEIKTQVEGIVTTPSVAPSSATGSASGSPPDDAQHPDTPLPNTGGVGGTLVEILFLLPPVVFIWFLLAGYRTFGIDLDADVQFWMGLAVFPLSAGLSAILAWGTQTILPSPGVLAEQNTACADGWCWQTITSIILLVLSLPVGGGAVVLVELLRHERNWNPSTPELVVTLIPLGGAALLAAATTLWAVETLRRIRRASCKLRGRAAILGIAWFWPVILAETLILMFMPTGSPNPLGPTLIYETEPKAAPLSKTIGKTSNVVQRRLGKGRERLAYARLLENGRQFAVGVIGASDADRRRVERLVTSPGTLEFRILADAKHNKTIVERALKEPDKPEVLDASGKKVAWWVPVKASEQRNMANYPGIVWRSTKQGDGAVAQVLVLTDSCNLTGGYLSNVETATDRRGKPCLKFTFCSAGGQLLAKLTGDHLPDKLTDFAYKLGIILNGKLWSAPSIHSRISDQAELTGSFTHQEASDLARILNAGALPVPLRLVEVAPAGTPNVSVIGPLQVSPLPAGWKLKLTYNGSNGIYFYSITPQEDGSGVLMFSRWPPPSKPEDIPTLLRQIADGFVKNVKKSSGVTLASEKYELEQFAGEYCKGSYVVFPITVV